MGISTLVLLGALASVGCSDRGHSPPAIDGSSPDVPVGTGDSGWEPTALLVSVAVLDFGTVDIGSVSSAQSVTVTVTGAPVGLTPTVIGAGFAISSTTCTNPQPPGTCTVSVRFSPATTGATAGELALGTANVALSGFGMPVSFGDPADRIDLGTVQINQTAPVVVPITTPSATGITCTASSADLTLVSQTCPSSGPVSAPFVAMLWLQSCLHRDRHRRRLATDQLA